MQNQCPICSRGSGDVCDRCFDEFERKEEKLRLKYIDNTIAFFSYEGILKNLMMRFKFNSEYAWGKIFGDIMLREFKRLGYNTIDFDIVTFIPSDPKRFFKRGFNQAKVMAKYFSKASGIPMKTLLYRNKIEKESHKITGIERKNLRHSFGSYESRVKGAKKILIIDDIITTGQTVSEAAKRIKLIDDIEVWAICLLGDYE